MPPRIKESRPFNGEAIVHSAWVLGQVPNPPFHASFFLKRKRVSIVFLPLKDPAKDQASSDAHFGNRLVHALSVFGFPLLKPLPGDFLPPPVGAMALVLTPRFMFRVFFFLPVCFSLPL